MSRHSSRRDPGMTLIELLVSIFVIGAIVAVLAATVTVTFRNNVDTQGRLDVARWGQSLAIWLPTDLSSAVEVDASEDLNPAICPSAECTFGSNALWLAWDDGSGRTTVSYRYGPAADGRSFILTRVECKAGTCTSRIVLRDLSGPVDGDGNPLPWIPGDEVPDDVIDVAIPLEVTETTPTGSTIPGPTTARRVTVNVNGAPGIDGIDRSSSVNFTAGGTTFETLEPTTYDPPQFLNANSGCGGPVTLVVDRSGSIDLVVPPQMANVRAGVRSFVQAFEGTPTQLQIVTFSSLATTLGTSGWNKFYDLANPADVKALIGPPGTGLVGQMVSGGGTNWEDAFYRTFYASNGQSYKDVADPSRPTPELVVFFTDGVPTFDRLETRSDSNSTSQPVIANNTPYTYKTATSDGSGYGSSFSPRGWRRADHILDQFRLEDLPYPTRMIGVGVGPAFNATAPPSTANSTRVYRDFWPGPTSSPNWIPNRVFLGDLMANLNPYKYGDGLIDSGGAITRDYVPGATNNGWGDVAGVNLLVTTDFTQLGGALTAIALVDCGGTLTVQTRDQAGGSAQADVTYSRIMLPADPNVANEQVTTTRLVKAGTFDIDLDGIASTEVELVPQSLVGTGYTATGWGCRAAGADLVAGGAIPVGESGFRLINPADPQAGIAVTVSASAAVSCTLGVTT